MKKVKYDLTGQQFGRWTVLYRADNKIMPCGRHQVMWHCVCACGKESDVWSIDLRRGYSTSCGCYAREHSTTHGQTKSRLYNIWSGMKKRCYRVKNKDYHNYGGRGITMCDEWRENFESFRDWSLSHGYRDDLSIDRIDNNQGYNPENCRWCSVKEQSNNNRCNTIVEFNGESHTISEWSDITGIPYQTLYKRIHNFGWSIEDCLTREVRKQGET